MGRAATAPLYAIPARRLASPETRQRRRWKARSQSIPSALALMFEKPTLMSFALNGTRPT
jgi:hypothetical protein